MWQEPGVVSRRVVTLLTTLNTYRGTVLRCVVHHSCTREALTSPQPAHNRHNAFIVASLHVHVEKCVYIALYMTQYDVIIKIVQDIIPIHSHPPANGFGKMQSRYLVAM